jgi:hypothetical protein
MYSWPQEKYLDSILDAKDNDAAITDYATIQGRTPPDFDGHGDVAPPQVTSRGIRLTLPTRPIETRHSTATALAWVYCEDSHPKRAICILIQRKTLGNLFWRVGCKLYRYDIRSMLRAERQDIYLSQDDSVPYHPVPPLPEKMTVQLSPRIRQLGTSRGVSQLNETEFVLYPGEWLILWLKVTPGRTSEGINIFVLVLKQDGVLLCSIQELIDLVAALIREMKDEDDRKRIQDKAHGARQKELPAAEILREMANQREVVGHILKNMGGKGMSDQSFWENPCENIAKEQDAIVVGAALRKTISKASQYDSYENNVSRLIVDTFLRSEGPAADEAIFGYMQTVKTLEKSKAQRGNAN